MGYTLCLRFLLLKRIHNIFSVIGDESSLIKQAHKSAPTMHKTVSRSIYPKHSHISLLSILCAGSMALSATSHAQDNLQACLQKVFEEGDPNLTLAQIREQCAGPSTDELAQVEVASPNGMAEASFKPGLISSRLIQEHKTEFTPYAITPHRLNYILPALTTNAINKEAYADVGNGFEENLEDVEAKFQISLKVPLNTDSLFIEGDGVYLGFTLEAWWQIYSSNISKPFRETNYQPEVFYFAPLNWQPFGGNTGFMVGVEHQSNGRSQLLSRSWNRVYGQFLFEKENFAFTLRPWVRLSEDEKQFEGDPKGDDNPDIEDFMGHFELGLAYKWDEVEFTYNGRQNFSTGKGAAEFGVVFPLYGKLKGYATAFTGYGDSLIDYNYKQTRFGLGIAFNDPL